MAGLYPAPHPGKERPHKALMDPANTQNPPVCSGKALAGGALAPLYCPHPQISLLPEPSRTMDGPLVDRVHPEMQADGSLEWWLTLGGAILALGIFFVARWQGEKPAEPLKARVLNYTIIQFAALVAVLVMVVHLLTLGSGKRFGGRYGEAPTVNEETLT